MFIDTITSNVRQPRNHDGAPLELNSRDRGSNGQRLFNAQISITDTNGSDTSSLDPPHAPTSFLTLPCFHPNPIFELQVGLPPDHIQDANTFPYQTSCFELRRPQHPLPIGRSARLYTVSHTHYYLENEQRLTFTKVATTDSSSKCFPSKQCTTAQSSCFHDVPAGTHHDRHMVASTLRLHRP